MFVKMCSSPEVQFSVAYGRHGNAICDAPFLVAERRMALGNQKARARLWRRKHLAKRRLDAARTILERLVLQRRYDTIVRLWEEHQFRPFREVAGNTVRRRLQFN